MTQSQSRIDTQFPFADDDIVITQLRLLMRVLELRFQRVELIQEDAEAQAQNLVRIGLARINEVLLPQVERIQRLTSLGFLIAHSDTGQTLALNQQATFFITDPDERDTFTPSPYVAIERAGDVNVRAVAHVLAYDRTVGALSVQVLALYGVQARYTDWVISATPGVSEATRADMTAAGVSAAQAAAALLNAQAARDAAAASATTAGNRASAAANSAVDAAGAANASASSATAASNSATAAANSAASAAGRVSFVDEQSLTQAQSERARRNMRVLGAGVIGTTAALALAASNANSMVLMQGGPYTVTLPQGSTVQPGDKFKFLNLSTAANTISKHGSDPAALKIFYGTARNTNTFTMPGGSSMFLQYDGTNWIAYDQTANINDVILTNGDQGLSDTQQKQARANFGGDASYFSRRNRIYDPALRFSQENGGPVTTPTPLTLFFVTDSVSGFRTSGITATVQRVVALTPNGAVSRARMTATNSAQSPGANDGLSLSTYIEGTEFADFAWGLAAGKSAVVRFMVNASVAGTYPVAVRNGTYTRSWIGTFVISAAEAGKDVIKSLLVPPDPVISATNWKTDGSTGATVSWAGCGGSSFVGVLGWQAGSLTTVAGCVNLLANPNATYEISELAFVDASNLQTGVIPRFELGDVIADFQKSQRYFCSMLLTLRANATGGGQPFSNSFALPVAMRTTPSAGLSSAPQRSNLNAVNMGVANAFGGRYEIVSAAGGDAYAIGDNWFFYARMG